MRAVNLHLPRLLHLPPTAAFMGVWFAVALHGIWATLLVFGDAPQQATAVHALAELFPARSGLILVLVAVAACAIYGLIGPRLLVSSRVMLLLPQQLALGVSAIGALSAMWMGQFADGTARSPLFIIADQAPAVLALLVHSATILYLGLSRRWT